MKAAKRKRSTRSTRAKQNGGSKPLVTITVKEYNWGSLFAGTKADLIAAGLAKPEHFKFRKGDSSGDYYLPLDWSDKYNEACYGPNRGPIPPRWDAKVSESLDGDKSYCVCVEYNITRDMAFRERAEIALINLQVALKMVADIAPKPVHEQLGFKAFGKEADNA